MHDVIPARSEQGPEVFHGDRLIDTFFVVRRIDDAWQAIEEPREALRNVKTLEASSASKLFGVAGYGRSNDEKAQRPLPGVGRPPRRASRFGDDLTPDCKTIDQPAIPVTEELPGVPHQGLWHLQYEMNGTISCRLQIAQMIADAEQHIVT
jgi:hypothetical protein